MTSTPTFRALVGSDAPLLLIAAGWHPGIRSHDEQYAFWHESLGDVIFVDAPDAALGDLLLATIDSPHVEAVIAVLEPFLSELLVPRHSAMALHADWSIRSITEEIYPLDPRKIRTSVLY